jgi:hypothetical protein
MALWKTFAESGGMPPVYSSLARLQWRNRKLSRQLVELGHELRRQRQAFGQAVGTAPRALNARQAHAFTRQRLGRAQFADVAVNLGLEMIERLKARR